MREKFRVLEETQLLQIKEDKDRKNKMKEEKKETKKEPFWFPEGKILIQKILFLLLNLILINFQIVLQIWVLIIVDTIHFRLSLHIRVVLVVVVTM